MMKASLHEDRTANLRAVDGRRCLELATVCQKLYKAPQNFVVRACPDVLLQRLFERRARAPLVRLEERDQVFRRAHVLFVRLDVTRSYLFAALPTECQVCGQHITKENLTGMDRMDRMGIQERQFEFAFILYILSIPVNYSPLQFRERCALVFTSLRAE